MAATANTLNQRPDSLYQTASQLVIAIDFGTTFTGVAYLHHGPEHGVDPHQNAQRIRVVRTWPNTAGRFTEKTPSKISYHTDPPAWGRQVRPADQPQASFFKLGLEVRTQHHYQSPDAQATGLLRGRRQQIGNKQPIDIVADYLTCVHTCLRDVIFRGQWGDTYMENQRTSYVITVPAIWSEHAKALTKQAATRAGIPENQISLITEPEAAAQYCAIMCEEADLQEGDRFLVCDAGGGTVDLISYELHRFPAFQISTCTPATGGACGAMHLDSGFEQLVRNKLGMRHAATILTPERLAEVRNYFDRVIKLEFNHFEENCEPEYPIGFPGLPDVPEIGIREGYLRLTKEEISQVFMRVFHKIHGLIDTQMQSVRSASGQNIKALFLVGGLGSSTYLAEFLRKQFDRTNVRVMLVQPTDGTSAIMKGAVLNKLGLKLVKSRIMQASYGLVAEPLFIPGEHPESRKFRDKIDGNVRCHGVMRWCVVKGARVEDEQIVRYPFVAHYSKLKYRFKTNLPLKCSVLISERDIPPVFREDHVKRLCTLEVNLKDLPDGAFKLYKGPKGEFYQASFDLALIFGPVVELQMMHGDTLVKSERSNYVLNEPQSPSRAATISSESLGLAPRAGTLVGHY